MTLVQFLLWTAWAAFYTGCLCFGVPLAGMASDWIARVWVIVTLVILFCSGTSILLVQLHGVAIR